MNTLSGFARVLLEAHKDAPMAVLEVTRADYQLALAASDWATRSGWSDTVGELASRAADISVSASGGELTVAWSTGVSKTYPVESVRQTLTTLVGAGLLPDCFSPHARDLLADLGATFDRAAAHLEDKEPNARADAVRTLRGAAASARGFLDRQQQLLIEGSAALERA